MAGKSSLPTDNALDKAVNTFGLGMYDEAIPKGTTGENSNVREPVGKSLPDGGGSYDPFGPDRLMGYPDNMTASARLPGDLDRNPANYRSDTIEDPVMTVAYAKLPEGTDGPVARSDYYDRTVTGSISDIWPTHGGDVWADDHRYDVDSLPAAKQNNKVVFNNTQPLGNFWSGKIIQDQDVPQGFPSTDYNVDRSPTISDSKMGSTKLASNPDLVRGLVQKFFAEFGKKDLTKRHFLAFLQNEGLPQYLSSEMILCASEDHSVFVKDVLDEFPFKKQASSDLRSSLISAEISHLRSPEVSKIFRHAAAAVAEADAYLQKKDRRS